MFCTLNSPIAYLDQEKEKNSSLMDHQEHNWMLATNPSGSYPGGGGGGGGLWGLLWELGELQRVVGLGEEHWGPALCPVRL